MRAIVVELPGPRLALPPIVEGEAVALETGEGTPATPGSGRLAPHPVGRPGASERAAVEGEPL
jgi:hypothetical protein